MENKYYKVCFEQTGSLKYIRTSQKECTVVLISGTKNEIENYNVPYPTHDGEWLEACTRQEYIEHFKNVLESKRTNKHSV
jgi:hypothetical protein